MRKLLLIPLLFMLSSLAYAITPPGESIGPGICVFNGYQAGWNTGGVYSTHIAEADCTEAYLEPIYGNIALPNYGPWYGTSADFDAYCDYQDGTYDLYNLTPSYIGNVPDFEPACLSGGGLYSTDFVGSAYFVGMFNGRSYIASTDLVTVVNLLHSPSNCILRLSPAFSFRHSIASYTSEQDCMDQLRTWVEARIPSILSDDWVHNDSSQIFPGYQGYNYLKKDSADNFLTSYDVQAAPYPTQCIIAVADMYRYEIPNVLSQADCLAQGSDWVETTLGIPVLPAQ